MVYGHPNFPCLICLSLYFLTHTHAYQNTSGLPCLPRLIILYSYQRIPKYYGRAWDFANLPLPQLSKQVISFFERLVQSEGFFYPSNVGFGIAIFTFLAPLLLQSYECLHTVDIIQIAPPFFSRIWRQLKNRF